MIMSKKTIETGKEPRTLVLFIFGKDREFDFNSPITVYYTHCFVCPHPARSK